MNISNPSQSVTLWLIIIFFGFTFAQAQQSSNGGTDNSAKNAEKEIDFAAQSAKFPTRANKIELNKNNFSSPVKTETIDKYKKQSGGSNREFGIYAGSFTFHKDLRGESQKAPVVLFGLRYAWTTKNNERHRLRYYIDFDPLIIVNYRERRPIQVTPTTTTVIGDRKTVFGVGFTPVGLQFNWRNSKKYQPYIAGGFGVAVFNKKFPDNRSPLQPDKIGNRFQLMPEFGAGLEIRTSETKSYFIGYKYHHLSNGYTAPLNVGYNTNMVYGGVYFQRGK